jgi:arsenite-transporting ATPase
LFVTRWKSTLLLTEKLLRDPERTQFVPVAIAEPLSIDETVGLIRELKIRKVPVSELVLNQLHLECDCHTCTAVRSAEQFQIEELLKGIELACPIWGIGLMAEEIRGKQLLAKFWDHTRLMDRRPAIAFTSRPYCGPRVLDPPMAPSEQMQFILFAGKGGVGKTTLSCVSAIRIAQDFPDKRVLLFSADPAHSLSACLQTRIGPQPTPLLPGLSAMEIDAKAEFEKLKARYAEDLEHFLQSVSRGFDLTFDRVVLERMLDLAPPGLDEVMALTRILGFLAEGRYDFFVLDCAPTGHLMRLLELPELINQWLKAFFNLFLKYEHIVPMPGFAEELVGISRNLKKFRELLRNPAASALYAISIPSRMALEETKDLVAGCDRMGIAVPLMFMNLMAPPCDCHLCAGLRRRESAMSREFQKAFPEMHQVQVYRHPQIAGLSQLEKLGQSLYEAAGQELTDCVSA